MVPKEFILLRDRAELIIEKPLFRTYEEEAKSKGVETAAAAFILAFSDFSPNHFKTMLPPKEYP